MKTKNMTGIQETSIVDKAVQLLQQSRATIDSVAELLSIDFPEVSYEEIYFYLDQAQEQLKSDQ